MIKIVIGTAKNNTIGSRIDNKINDERFKLMEKHNVDINKLLEHYESENIVGGPYTILTMVATGPHKNTYLLSKEKDIDLSNYDKKIKIITDYRELVKKYQNSKEVLTVIGGKIVFDLFTPYAKEIFAMEVRTNLPGELKYDFQKDETQFKLTKSEKTEGAYFNTYTRI